MNIKYSRLSEKFKQYQLAIVYLCTILTLCTLYAAQPIQPLFEKEFSLTRFEAVMFTATIMFPLGFAPIFYGSLLEGFSSKYLLRICVLMLGILEIVFAFSNSYTTLLILRGLQGLLIPAVLTSLMSYISIISPRERISQAMGYYVGATILGGFLGRLFSGFVSEIFGWRPFFAILGIVLCIMYFVLSSLDEGSRVFSKPSISQVFVVLKNRSLVAVYGLMFLIFFVFQALLNFIPFQLRDLGSGVGYGKVGMLYAGYIVGFFISIRIVKIVHFFKGEGRAILFGIIVYVVGLQFFHIQNYYMMFLGMFVFCSGFFLIHSTASGLVNKLESEKRATPNGLYLAAYYSGGTIGAFSPGLFFHYLGWSPFVLLLSVIALISIYMLLKIRA